MIPDIVPVVLLLAVLALLILVLAAQGRAQSVISRENEKTLRALIDVQSALRELRQLGVENAHAEEARFERLRAAVEQNDRSLRDSNDLQLERMRATLEGKLTAIQKDNQEKLENIRVTVDEKLSSTLNKRLGESFTLVNERLEAVYKGLGEMQTLAVGVGDLKKVLTSVKTRGMWGEVQLGALLEQVLAPGQYETNAQVKPGSGERVEYAVKLPGREEGSQTVYLPIDAKFPSEDYQRLLDAGEAGDKQAVEAAGRALEATIRAEAKRIHTKYIDPPHTTDFAIMFLPVEGLFAEVLKRGGMVEQLQSEYRVVVTGPTTLLALLNSLQMGFRTLAIERRSSEVWQLLGAVKTEFGRFADLLSKTQQRLHQATASIEDAARKTRTIQRRLQSVQELSERDAKRLIGEQGEGMGEPCEGDAWDD